MAAKRRVWPRRVRRAVQASAFACFVAFVAAGPLLSESGARGDWLMRFSPLSGLAASASARQVMWGFWPAAALLLGAVLLGRFFCGWVCPLGTTLDLADRVAGFLRPRRRDSEGRPEFEHVRGRRVKHYVLVACVVGAAVGVPLFGLLDPLGVASRGAYVFVGAFPLQAATLLVLVAVLALNMVRRRFWCRYVCPLGALYALAGRASLARRRATDACIECGLCAQACPTACISRDGKRTLHDECILCLDCQAVCPVPAVRFFGAAPTAERRRVNLSRRGVLAGAAAGVAAHPVFHVGSASAAADAAPPIRPPLAGRDVGTFLRRCLRCGQCVRACPTNVIQPSGLADGLGALWTPELRPRPAYCEYDCDLCGQACPTGAIPPFTLEEKHRTAMGLASVDRSRCIPWVAGSGGGPQDMCGLCVRACPVPGKAIRMMPLPDADEDDLPWYVPYVLEDACIGCGRCESVCPVSGPAAIRVAGGFRDLPPRGRGGRWRTRRRSGMASEGP